MIIYDRDNSFIRVGKLKLADWNGHTTDPARSARRILPISTSEWRRP